MIVDATGVPEVGARVAVAAIRARKHVVMLNVEADITVGRALKQMADDAGVVYTASAGDEYAATKELVWLAVADQARAHERQRELLPVVFGSEDAKEGATAFVEKRPPVWKGK